MTELHLNQSTYQLTTPKGRGARLLLWEPPQVRESVILCHKPRPLSYVPIQETLRRQEGTSP